MSMRTTYLSRLLGCYSIMVGLAMMVHKQAMVEMMKELATSSAAIYAVGLIAIAVGLAMVLGHNVWQGGALPVVVTLIGWWSLIKGLLCLFLPQSAIAGLLGGSRYEQYYYVTPAISLLAGIFLIVASSKRKRAAVK